MVLVKKIRATVNTPADEYAFDLSLTGAVTTNSSWLAQGNMQWLPPLPYTADTSGDGGLLLGKVEDV
jgi:hypothetical protein